MEDVTTPAAYQQYLDLKAGSVRIVSENNRKCYSSLVMDSKAACGQAGQISCPICTKNLPRKFRDPIPALKRKQAAELSSMGLLYELTEPNDAPVAVPASQSNVSSTNYSYISICPTAGNNSLAVKARKHYPRLRTLEEEEAELDHTGGVVQASFGRDMLQKLKQVESAFLEAAGEYEMMQQSSHLKFLQEHKAALEQEHAAAKAAFSTR